MAGSLEVRQRNAAAERKRRFEVEVARLKRNNAEAFSNMGAMASGIASVPGQVFNYFKTSTPSKVVRDVKSVAKATYDAAAENPNAFIQDAVASIPAGFRDFADVRATARKLRAQGRTAEAKKLEAMAGTAALGIIPVVGRVPGAVVGKAVKAANKAPTPKAPDLKVTPKPKADAPKPKAAAPKAKPLEVKPKPAAPAYLKTGSGANRDMAADVFAATSSKQKGAPSFSDWRAANEDTLGTMFDYGSLRNVPDVPQFQIERSVPAQGPSTRIVDALANPDVARGINETVERGAERGGLEWYNTDPLYRRLVSSVGETNAPEEYSRLMDVVAATSPRAKVQDNIRMASYYNYLLKNGIPIPDKPAAGYGSIAQGSHVKHARNIGNEGGWNIFENPKPASFSSNLQGNPQVATIDTHNFRLPGIISQDPRFLATSFDELVKPELNDRTKIISDLVAQYPNMQDVDIERFVSRLDGPKPKVSFRPQDWLKSGSISMDEAVDRPNFWASQPNDNEYGYYEKWQQDQAEKLGMSPAQYQASMWVGGGEDTGLGSVAEPFLKTFEARIKYTADRLGVSPDVVMEKMLKGEMPLMAQGGSVDVQELAEKYAV